MSAQLEVIKFRDLLPVEQIPRFVPGFDHPTVELKGEDFRSVSSVYINEIPAPEFIILNKHTLYVQLPDAAQRKVSNIEVLSNNFTKTNKFSKIEYKIGNKTKTISGVLKLVQLFTKWMLQSPGSDIFNPERGGGLQEMVGKITTTRNMEPIISSVTRSIQTTVTQIRSSQVNTPQLPLDERLLSADIFDVNIYEKLMEARIKVMIRCVAGQEAVASLEL